MQRNLTSATLDHARTSNYWPSPVLIISRVTFCQSQALRIQAQLQRI